MPPSSDAHRESHVSHCQSSTTQKCKFSQVSLDTCFASTPRFSTHFALSANVIVSQPTTGHQSNFHLFQPVPLRFTCRVEESPNTTGHVANPCFTTRVFPIFPLTLPMTTPLCSSAHMMSELTNLPHNIGTFLNLPGT